MAEKYRVGIVGCGSIANLHARGYQGLDNVEMVALADPVQTAADAFGDQYGIENRYMDFRQMLDEEDLDIVSNATWHKLHAPITIAICARKPKAVLCEKPMATCMGECNEMMIACPTERSEVGYRSSTAFQSCLERGARSHRRRRYRSGAACHGGGEAGIAQRLFSHLRYDAFRDGRPQRRMGDRECRAEDGPL